MNIDDTILFMGRLRSADTNKCPSCNGQKHTKECDFGDFSVAEVLLMLYVDPVFGSSNDLPERFAQFLQQRAGRAHYLDCVCYVLTNDIVYKQLDIDEQQMVQVLNKSTNQFRTWWRVIILLNSNSVLRDTSDEARPTKIQKSITALSLYVDIKSGTVGGYNVTTVSERQRMIATYMIYYLQRFL